MKPSLRRLLFGTEEVPDEAIALRAGPLDVFFSRGRLLDIRAGDVEIWHGVSFTFRDPDWGTPEPILEQVDIARPEDGFRIRCEGHFPTSPRIELGVDIEGASDGRIRFSGQAVPTGDVATNRLGLCLLHPMSVCGKRLEIEHADGRLTSSTFPILIPPWPVFMPIRRIRHEYMEGRWARCEFFGEVFELEDQRNNSDASFKTYSRSNMMPRPYRLRAGVAVRQSLELSVESPPVRRVRRRASAVTVLVGEDSGALAKIGIEVEASDSASDEATRAALCALRPASLHLRWTGESDAVEWAGIAALLAASKAQFRLDIDASEGARGRPALENLARALRTAGIVPESVAVFPGEQVDIDSVRSAFPNSRVGGGTAHYFAQLNRLESMGRVDFVSFTTSPLVHGADDDSVMLSLQSLRSMVATRRARFPALPIRVGPSSIAVRRSPLGGQPQSDGTTRMALARDDPRCHGLYGAAWTLGYVAELALAGAEAVTLMSLGGSSGVVARGGARYPTFFLLARLGRAARIRSASVSEPSRVAALALHRPGQHELLLANLTGEPVDVALEGWPLPSRSSIMDADSWTRFTNDPDGWSAVRQPSSSSPVRLSPYAVTSLEH